MRSVAVLVIMTIIANLVGTSIFAADRLVAVEPQRSLAALTCGTLNRDTITAQALRSPLLLWHFQALHWFCGHCGGYTHRTDLPMLLAIGSRFIPELQAMPPFERHARIRLANLAHQEPLPPRCAKVVHACSTGRELLVPLLRLSFHRAGTLGDA